MSWNGVQIGGSRLCININGWMVFTNSAISQDPVPAMQGAVAVFGHDLKSDANSHVYWQLDGTGAQQRLIVQWSNVPFYWPNTKKVTAQAQLYASGDVVLAYQDVQGTAPGDTATVGVLPSNDMSTLIKPAAGLLTDGLPATGDRFALFSVLQLPFTLPADPATLSVSAVVGNGTILIDDAPSIVPAGQVTITEAMVNPPLGSADGQWLEVTNNTATAFDLSNWDIDFGHGARHTIAATVLVPANGRVVLGQTQTSAGAATVSYAYGSHFSFPNDGTPVILSRSSGTYASLGLPYGTVMPGFAVQRGALAAGVANASSATDMVCTAPTNASYAPGAHGTPGAANSTCPSYTYDATPIPGAFEFLSNTGGTRIVPSAGSDNSIDAVTPTAPVRFAGRQFSTIYVGTNGFVTLAPVNCANSANCFATSPTSFYSSSRMPVGAIAPFWDDLDLNALGGIYWARRTPNVTPNDGYTVVSWENVKRVSSTETYSLNFQIKFFDTGNIEFHYGTMSGTGGSGTAAADNAKGQHATTWLEVPEGGIGFTVNVNSTTPGITPSTGFRFTAQ
jgi:hypothetical protein